MHDSSDAPQTAQPQASSVQQPTATVPQPPLASEATSTATVAAANSQSSRFGTLIVGVAIGALVGGIVGGGAAALVAENKQTTTVQQSTGPVTLSNLETATTVSGVAAAAMPSVVTLTVEGRGAEGSGSGVIYSEDGYLVTNAHVVTLDGEAGPDPKIRVRLSDGRILDGTVVGTDPFADLAVVQIDADQIQAIALADAAQVNVGDLAVAIGAPLNLANTVTSGVVSALHRGISVGSPIIPEDPNAAPDDPEDNGELPWFRFGDPNESQGGQAPRKQAAATVTLPVIQTDASINPGNSGGALLNANGELIGVNVAIATNGGDSSTAGSVGLGFAIPVNMVKRVADALIAGEQPSHGLLGIGVADSSNDIDDDRNIAGGLVSEVTPAGPADNAGLLVGDVITAVDGVRADSSTTVSALIRMHAGGDEVLIGYTRNGVPGETTVVLDTLTW